MADVPTRVREAIVHAYHRQELSYSQIADLLGVGQATVSRVLRRQRERGSVDRLPRGGGNVSPIHGVIADILRRIVHELPDATVAELTDALVARSGVPTSRSGVQRALHRLGFSRKKSPSSPRSATRRNVAATAGRSARS